MPPVRSSPFRSIVSDSLALAKCVYTAAVIVLFSKVMLSCLCCVEKGLKCIAIAALSGRQRSSYAKYIKSNMRLSCNIQSVSDAECMRLICL